MTLAHRELAPILELLNAGHAMTAPIAAALGRTDRLKEFLKSAPADEVQHAFGMAVINEQAEAARLALDAGADVNGFLPVHSHSTSLHEAATDDNLELLGLLIERGARTDIADKLWNSTPLGWTIH